MIMIMTMGQKAEVRTHFSWMVVNFFHFHLLLENKFFVHFNERMRHQQIDLRSAKGRKTWNRGRWIEHFWSSTINPLSKSKWMFVFKHSKNVFICVYIYTINIVHIYIQHVLFVLIYITSIYRKCIIFALSRFHNIEIYT